MAYKDSTEEFVLDQVLANLGFAADDFYLAFYLSAPTDSTEGAEVTGGSYARQLVTLARTDQQLDNTTQVTFPLATADWGTIVSFALHDAATGTGNQVMYGNLATSKIVVTGEQIIIDIGEFTQTID